MFFRTAESLTGQLGPAIFGLMPLKLQWENLWAETEFLDPSDKVPENSVREAKHLWVPFASVYLAACDPGDAGWWRGAFPGPCDSCFLPGRG